MRETAQLRRLNMAFLAVVVVMAAHEAEHVAQVVQKDVLREPCPGRCRGALGFVFDVEWVHFGYNVSIFAALAALYAGYRMWRPPWRARALTWTLVTGGVFLIQGYHVIEHVAKLQQWFDNGHRSPTPGVLGKHVEPPIGHAFSLIELHFVLNTVVFACVLAGYLGYGFHRHVPRVPRLAPVAAVAVLLATAPAAAWAMQAPTVRLAAGVHDGPLLIERPQKLVGEPGATVRGGIVITSNGVTVRGVHVVAGENGVVVDGAKDVVLDDVSVSGAELDGFHVRRSSVAILDCRVTEPGGAYAQAIDISFAFDKPPSLVQGCTIVGGQEGIVSHFAHVRITRNLVERTTLRGIAITEMSMGRADRNSVRDALGVGIFCGDYSHCQIEDNTVVRTRRDTGSDDHTRLGYAIQAHFGATATVGGNRVEASPGGMGAFIGARIRRD